MFLLFLITILHLSTSSNGIGVNYGTIANNLPPPAQVANFLKTKTIINSIKIFYTNPQILHAFADTNISVMVTIPNGDIPALTNPQAASRWVNNKIKPFYPQTLIKYIGIGNEILLSGNQNWIKNLVPCMKAIHNALVRVGCRNIKVSTPHALNYLTKISPPSQARIIPLFSRNIFVPMLQFLRKTKSPLMINPYPYFIFSPKNVNYALFRPNRGVYDPFTKITYYNMYDALLDATYSAIKAMGYGDINILVGETGWPSRGQPGQNIQSVANAADYNRNLVKKTLAGKGTPLMPNRKFETYIFGLFNENLKPGPIAERNWGLFRPDFSLVYDAGVMRNKQAIARPRPGIGVRGKKWCVPKREANDKKLQANIQYACGQGINCKPIQVGGACFNPNTIKAHAAFAMNSYFQTHGANAASCFFANSGFMTTINPSHGNCKFM